MLSGAVGADQNLIIGAFLLSASGAELFEVVLSSSTPVAARTAEVSRVTPAAESSSASNKLVVGGYAKQGADKAVTSGANTSELKAPALAGNSGTLLRYNWNFKIVTMVHIPRFDQVMLRCCLGSPA
eukprot:1180734-Prorocentrum_minimum.AAC.2